MSLELLKKRLQARGGNAEGRMAKEKLETLRKALLYSYQAETIVKDGDEYRCLINNNKLKMDYDDRIISVPFDSNIKVGDIFYWGKTKENWIVYLQQFSEDAYFRGFIRKAQHKLKWLNEYGKELETFSAVRGPVETKVKGERKSDIIFDVPNYTLSAIIPNNEYTKDLKRYTKITLDGQVWEVTVADSISEPGVIDLQLIESYKNKDEDSDVVGGLIKPNIRIETSLDGLNTLEIGTPLPLECKVYVNGIFDKEISDKSNFTVKNGEANIVDNNLIFNSVSQSTIALDIESANINKEFFISGEELIFDDVKTWRIDGNENVKSYGSTEYKVKKYINGIESVVSGEWRVANNDALFSIADIDKNTIKLKWCSGMVGSIELEYYEEDTRVISKKINIESLL